MDNNGCFSVLPMGQYCQTLPEGFPSHRFRLIQVKDPSGDSNVIDSYDAVFGSIAMESEAYELVHVYHTLDELLEAVRSRALPDDLDLLVMGVGVSHCLRVQRRHEARGRNAGDAARARS